MDTCLETHQAPRGSHGNRGALPRGVQASGRGAQEEPLGWCRRKQPEFKVIWEHQREADTFTPPPSFNPHLSNARCVVDHRQLRTTKDKHRCKPKVKARIHRAPTVCHLGTAEMPSLDALI